MCDNCEVCAFKLYYYFIPPYVFQMLHVVALSTVTIILRSSDLYTEWDDQISLLPTPLSEIDTPRWIRLDGISTDTDFRHSHEPVAMPSAPFKDPVLESADGTQYLIRHRTNTYRKALSKYLNSCMFSISVMRIKILFYLFNFVLQRI